MSMFRKPGESDHSSTSEGSEASPEHEESSKSKAIAQVPPKREPTSIIEPFLIHYISYIERECREKALKTLNSLRSPEEQFPESHPDVKALSEKIYNQVVFEIRKTGIPLGEFSGEKGVELRKNYSKNFGTALSNAANLALEAVQDMDRPISSALPFTQLTIDQGAQDLLLSSGNNRAGAGKSIYADEYRQLEFLGKGGYGKVFKCLNSLDGQEYAIKQIVISPAKMEKLKKEGRLETLFLEIKTFAKLNHPNLVRYYHSWWEPLNKEDYRRRGTIQGLIDNREDSDLSSYDSNGSKPAISNAAPSPESSDVFEKPKDNSFQGSSDVKFEGSTALEKSPDIKICRKRRQGQSTKTSYGRIPIPSGITIFIKMSLHHTTLSRYLSPHSNPNLPEHHRYCYHAIPAAKLCLAILDGVIYLHHENIVHRDLKPANILLSIQETCRPQSHTGFVDIAQCRDCGDRMGKSVYITPHISDFGLTARLDDPNALQGLGKSMRALEVGTKAYRPLDVPSKEPVICPKMDIYSLGVIAFELITKFTTEFERRKVLEGLSHGIFPDGFEKHDMAEGIRNMICGDRDQRWDSKQVKSWLQGILEEGKPAGTAEEN